MKDIKLPFFACCLLVSLICSCSKDKDPDQPAARLASLEETSVGPLMNPLTSTLKYSFGYDDQHRVSAMNDRYFFYGNNGKVSYSRINRISLLVNGMTHEYKERLRYEWDDQGRLSSVVGDTLYHHVYSGDAQHAQTQLKSLKTGWVLARYSYNGTEKLPRSITSIIGYEIPTGEPTREKYDFSYSGADVSHQLTTQEFPGPLSSTGQTLSMSLNTWYRYSTHPHFLYNIYKQLGFNPCNLNSVVSAHTHNEFVMQVQSGNANPDPDWSKAEQVTASLDNKGNVTELRSSTKRSSLTYY